MNTRPVNLTRRTTDLPAKFRREGRWHLIPIYHLLQLSDLGREGIAHSGSYRFADHLYRGEPSGRGWPGKLIDRILLNLPAAQGMRARCPRATQEMKLALSSTGPERPLRILTIPCGIPRDVYQLAEEVGPASIEYTGMDLDPKVLAAAEGFLANSKLQNPRLVQGDALDLKTWPPGQFDFVSSTGLGEFLNDDDLSVFYRNAYEALAPDGVFFTSVTAREPRADWLLKAFEFETNYRSQPEVESILRKRPWRTLVFDRDETGLQTFVRATR
jgi:SAM-dependent methyltransferase